MADMANPVTSIINPINDRILRYWVTRKQHLALNQIPIDNKHGQQTIKYKENGTPAGNHCTNQCIAAIYLRGVPTVYGKVTKTTGTTTSLVLAQLSPITNIVAEFAEQPKTITDLPGFAAVSDKDSCAWFYFLRKIYEKSPPFLIETSIEYDEVKTTIIGELQDNQRPNPNSRLAALYVDGKCEVFFQKREGQENKLYYFTVGDGAGPQPIAGTGLAYEGTSISVVRTKAGICYLYWFAYTGEIQRATRSDGTWQISTATMTKFKVNKGLHESQLTVTHTDLSGELVNHVVYIEENDSEYTSHRDELSKPRVD